MKKEKMKKRKDEKKDEKKTKQNMQSYAYFFYNLHLQPNIILLA